MLVTRRYFVFWFWCSLGEFSFAKFIEISGEFTFDLRVRDEQRHKNLVPVERSFNVTAAPFVECVYQYPELQQIDAVLSNMMNQLTKLFVRVHQYVAPKTRRRGMKRFIKVDSKSTDFFDDIYANMTEEYRRFTNETWERVARASDRDPCLHQNEVKTVWQDLLDTSQSALRRAAHKCVDEYLKVLEVDNESKEMRSRAKSLLHSELSSIKADQLALLCETFQLCYHDLM